ncbi:CPBP family intramembrane glutamic endopeptidase [Ulvibacterium sp.]|uniref:CPBP family intramembrane glutamic endopeptidase n=1 Tax=Ulvibacterium sp. TaxID=2665914 RepID=UPI003BAA512A
MKTLFTAVHPHYAYYENLLKAKSRRQKFWAIANYLLPGIVFTLLINIRFVHDSLSSLFHLSSREYQFWVLIALTFGWHMAYPLYALRVKEQLNWTGVLRALNLDKLSLKGILLITPLFFLIVLLFVVPYMGIVFPKVHSFLQSVEVLKTPEHSIFANYETMYGFHPWQLALLFIGNFVGEEVYFRGYLMKKSAFLGKHNWWIHSLLFSFYHLWQIPMTYALTFVVLVFGLFMVLRKNLYELMLLHILINLVLPVVVQMVWYS